MDGRKNFLIAKRITYLNNHDNESDEWSSDVRCDACIVIDDAALAWLLNTAGCILNKILSPELSPWVVVVDTKDPTIMP